MKERGYCYSDNEIKQLVLDERIIGSDILLENTETEKKQVQPASFDPKITEELFVLSTKGDRLFRPNREQQVFRNLTENVSTYRRQKRDCTNGYELKKDYTYLLKLEEKLKLEEGERVKSSPKSSLGRLFINSRLIADYSDGYDETGTIKRELDLWLVVQPQTFNLLIYPGLRLNQLRFFKGDAKLRDHEIEQLNQESPLTYERRDGELIPVKRTIWDGLEVRLDLEGKANNGIVGFKAIDNPEPIDLSQAYTNKKPKKEQTNLPKVEEYFDPIKKGKVIIQRGDHCLFATQECFYVPGNCSAELKADSHLGIKGPCHFAGFVDPEWIGDIVLEWRSDELTGAELTHGMPVSRMDFYRNNNPKDPYGEKAGSSYAGQTGVKVAKFFFPPDFTHIAREYQIIDREVLVRETPGLLKHRESKNGFELMNGPSELKLFDDIAKGFYKSRYECESDQEVLQPIPYLIFFGEDNCIFSYVRSSDMKKYGEPELFGKRSLGLGGHIHHEDSPQYVQKCLEREINRKVNIKGHYTPPKLMGTLMCYDQPVDRRHFGIIYASLCQGDITPKSGPIKEGSMIPLEDFDVPILTQNYETWSTRLIPHLKTIYKQLKGTQANTAQ